MKGRWKRLNENENKWVAACKEANARRRSGMSDDDVEKEAHSIYEAYVDNQESGASSKRSKTSEDGGFSIPSNPETPTSKQSTATRPIGRDKAKRKGKELRAIRLTRDAEAELIKTRIELEREKLQRNTMNMKEKMLLQLLVKEHLSSEDKEMKQIAIQIVEAATANDEFFQQRRDATSRVGLSSLQKCTGAMWVLAYGTSSDVVDEYLRMSSSSTRDALVHFVEGVISCFGGTYLKRPNEQDLARLLYVGEQRGFPGMIGSIDCMHWEWKKCPNAWADQYTGRSGNPTIILEVVASYDLWI
ncbi:glutathione S-transferase T2-like [Salvia miltiorrhiza]|uniref:glutathione S-transferase T2-like n=1 Tax=Salvia miltiorrhiza TaxID=226208 RepID=UPI0025AD3696|nr:glutathione S-transferase T2-like [Salvia miltiorrhiza]